MVGLLGAARAAGNIPTPKPSNDLLRAFHGSPHDFPPVDMIVNKETGKTYYVETDRFGSYKNHPVVQNSPDNYEFIEHFPQGHFDNSKMGTGEGVQAYGHGAYVAGNEDVARGYRDQLKGNIVIRDDGVQKTYGDHITEIETAIKEKFPNLAPDNVRTTARAVVNDNLVPDDVQGMGAFDKTGYRAEDIYLEGIRANKGAKASKGSMYEVDIDASPDEFLDYDIPLTEQSELVRNVLKDYDYKTTPEQVSEYDNSLLKALYGPEEGLSVPLPKEPRNPKGSVIYRDIQGVENMPPFDSSSRFDGAPEASAALAKKGIKGIRYKDGFSRNKDGGSSNYVIFDDRLITISRKYGISIPAAAAMLAAQSEEAEAGPISIAAGARRILDPRFSVPVGEGGFSNVRKGLLDPMATVGAEITPREIDTGPSFQLSDFEGQPYIISQSDRSAAGGILDAVGGTQIDPVDLRGGRDFMFENPGMAWASDPKVVNSLLERATKLKTDHKQNPLLLPYTMAPTGIDFATMPLDAMINFARSNMSKTNIKKLDDQIKKIIPKWGGVANPTSNAIFRDSTGDQRKMVADVIDKQFKGAKGGLSIAEARAVTSDANQYLSNDGSMVNIGRIDASSPAIADSGHPTYLGGLPGEGVGTFKEPLDLRKFIANNGRVVTNKPNDIRAASINPALTQGIIDEKLLRAQEGSIDPRLAAGLAATSAAGPTLADQGAGIMDFLANAAQGAIAPIANAPNTIIQALTSDRSNEQLKADRDQRLAQNDYQLRTDLGQQYTQNAQETMGGLLQSLAEQAEQSRILEAVRNSRILQTIPNAYNQLPERGRIVGNALLDSFL